MKSLFTLLFICLSFAGFCRNTTFEKLSEVNRCWREQQDVSGNLQVGTPPNDETGWIRLHLQLVERTLRSRSTAMLSAEQASNRMKSLDDLHAYWHIGRFPVNEENTRRTPIFIDRHDNFCAVGYLVKASGYEAVSRRIAAETNLAYVREMNYPELRTWALEHGFTIDELAWIQPGYPPVHYSAPIGKGVNGEVRELLADDAGGKLYVGGSFTTADSSLTANNIAYVTETGGIYTWHSMGSGVSGPVNAIVKYNDKIYVAGSFSAAGGIPVNNVACWDGSAWSPVGCIFGTVYDLAVMNGELYAAGSFDVCAALTDVNLARWTGTAWQQMPGLSGRINTMHVMDTTLILGGAFIHNNVPVNVMRWSAGTWFRPYGGSGIANEVKDFEVFGDTLYAACKRTSTTDTTNLIVRLKGDQWLPLAQNGYLQQFVRDGLAELSFNTLCPDGDQLMLGGSFFYFPGLGTIAANSINILSPGGTRGQWFLVDSAINKMVVFKNTLISGGNFITGESGRVLTAKINLNGIARRETGPASVPIIPAAASFECYPNPVAGGMITIRNNFGASRYAVRDVSGRLIAEGSLKLEKEQVALPRLIPGLYFIELSNGQGPRAAKRITMF